MKPRALLLSVDYAPQTGGQPLLVSSIVDATTDLVDWRVVTAAPSDEADERIVRTTGLLGILRATWAQRHWLAEADDRLIVSGHVYLGWVAHLVGMVTRTQVSTLCYGRELVPARLHQKLALRSMRHDHRVITISSHSERLLHELGIEPERTGWVGCELTPPAPVTATPRDGTDKRPGGARLVAITRLAEGYKNLEVIIRAAAILAQDGTVDRLTIIGDGPRRGALAARIEQLGAGDSVVLAGRLDDQEMADVLADADIGLFPSRDSIAEGGFEGFGIVVQELATAGLPVIVGDAAGATDAAHPEWSRLVDPDDLRQWVETIDELVDDTAERRALAAAAADFGMALDTVPTARAYLDELRGAPAPTAIPERPTLFEKAVR